MPDLARVIFLHAAHYMMVPQEANKRYMQNTEGVRRAIELFDDNVDNIRLGQARAAQMADSSQFDHQLPAINAAKAIRADDERAN